MGKGNTTNRRKSPNARDAHHTICYLAISNRFRSRTISSSVTHDTEDAYAILRAYKLKDKRATDKIMAFLSIARNTHNGKERALKNIKKQGGCECPLAFLYLAHIDDGNFRDGPT